MGNVATLVSRGRPRRFRDLENLRDNPPANSGKRAHYINGIGLLHGTRGITAYLKIRLPNGASKEMKVGSLASWGWQELEDRRRFLQGRVDRGEPLEDKKPVKFADHATAWLERKRHSVKGLSTLQGHIRKHLLPSFGVKLLTAISTSDVNAWIAKQRADGLKPATVVRQGATLNAILNDAVKVGLIDKNPAKLADKVGGCVERQRFFDPKQLDIILDTAKRIDAEDRVAQKEAPQIKVGWVRQFMLWALHSGMRRGEILRLTLDDIIDLENDRTVVTISTSKSGKPRVIYATPAMRGIVDELRQLHRDADDKRLFPVSLTTVKRKLTKLWKETGLDDARLHDLRRTNATILCRQGMDMRTLAGRLGHRDTKMLMSTYAVFGEDLAATKTIDNAFLKFS